MPTITRDEAIRRNYPVNHWFVQTILLSDAIFTKTRAKNWLKSHGYKFGDFRRTRNFHRFMQTNPVRHSRYYTEIPQLGVEVVYQRFA